MSETETKEIQDFEKKDSARISIKERRRKEQGGAAAMAMRENQTMLTLFAVIVAAIAVILIGILKFDIPAVSVCVIVILEAAIAACLRDVPIWLHALVEIIQIAAGVICHNTAFMILCALLYLGAIFALRFMREQE